ncbi:vWA domain-containing protein [Sedimentisphaera salicampi]|uniref:von Willebrand factor type A domain protein n=1 Tax=Sedimentisphaera salicampi TaxID=1941349 RepID=A0A1W6LLK6_9BACT|nr:VWA domain-containing protein [Sedimentisphaera salicampi]ARN56678.1 von Willebrand factor type A domain protein [Sedimentisphaera salicampi]OXU15116.1 von Willebrand factor type A domain protein [Sedimentisphaera salicampi]
MFEFHSPLAFLLFGVLFLLLVWKRLRGGKQKSFISYSDISIFSGCGTGWRTRLAWLPDFLRAACLVLLVFAAARPREGTELSNVSTEGVAMQLVVDRSSSMNEPMVYEGQKISRFDTVKMVIEDFITGGKGNLEGRRGDMIGLVSFARYPDTLCPLVLTHNILIDFLKQSETVKYKQEDGTAIGDAVALAAARLQQAETQISETSEKLTGQEVSNNFEIKSKVIVLLTDGMNNAGERTPEEAAELAKKWGIKIYAVGIGSNMPQRSIFDIARAKIDERLLNSIADKTGGFYARADSPKQLREIYEKIDRLEETEIKSVAYYNYAEKFQPFALAAFAALLLEIILRTTLLRKLP